MKESGVMAIAVAAGLALSWAGFSGLDAMADRAAAGERRGAVRPVAYRPAGRALTVEFGDGRRREYEGVPLEVYRLFLEARSRGVFFNDRIRGRYPCRTERPAQRGEGLPGGRFAGGVFESPCGPDEDGR